MQESIWQLNLGMTLQKWENTSPFISFHFSNCIYSSLCLVPLLFITFCLARQGLPPSINLSCNMPTFFLQYLKNEKQLILLNRMTREWWNTYWNLIIKKILIKYLKMITISINNCTGRTREHYFTDQNEHKLLNNICYNNDWFSLLELWKWFYRNLSCMERRVVEAKQRVLGK